MTSAAVETLAELSRRGIAVRVDGESIRLKPRSALDDQLLARVREYKSEILAVLSVRPAGCSTSAGPKPGARQVERWCAHCAGQGVCACPACNLRRVSGAAPCCMCAGEARQAWLATTQPQTCWHCRGEKVCRCITCCKLGGGFVQVPGECTVCHGSGKVPERVQ